MSSSSEHFEQLLQARLAGQSVEVPGDLAAELEQAVAAHAALRHLLEPTAIGQQPPEAARTPPAVSPDYVIEREIGQGGMGVVYLARQRSLNRAVALKVLRPGQQTFGPLVDRFLHEAQHLAQLRHPHIVAIHEVGQAAGEPYFTMDYVDGEPLTAILARGPLTPSRAIDILKQVAAAVQYAHRHGIIHRDLKPGNVLLDRRGHAFVTDFGLARNVHHDARLTQTGELLGTPQYMAPEQARGQSDAIGEATDIHALGLLLFEMLTGRAAFLASSPADVLVKLLHEEPPPARSLDRRIPRDLETICAKCLQKSPGARYANVSALLEDIRRYENGEALSARPTGWLVRTSRWCRRRWRVAATALAAAALTLVIASQLFDRSFDDLVAWGDEELASGHVDVAAQVYSRALKQASAAQQGLLVERIAQTCRGLDDPQAATKLALQILPIAPDISFGRHNFLIAQALVSRERARSPSGAIDIWRIAPTSSLKLVQKRLEMAQAGGLSSLQELEAEQTLTAIKLVLSQSKPVVRFLPDYLYELPQGGPEELAEAIDDEQQPIWNRARAAIALGDGWKPVASPRKRSRASSKLSLGSARSTRCLAESKHPVARSARSATPRTPKNASSSANWSSTCIASRPRRSPCPKEASSLS
ncbi:MAG: serine/threonine-protein kinase [Aureliella sp.]